MYTREHIISVTAIRPRRERIHVGGIFSKLKLVHDGLRELIYACVDLHSMPCTIFN